jgi:hypothetical protein
MDVTFWIKGRLRARRQSEEPEPVAQNDAMGSGFYEIEINISKRKFGLDYLHLDKITLTKNAIAKIISVGLSPCLIQEAEL